MASIFFFPQTSTDKPRPRQWRCACVPRKRAVVTDGGSLMRSRARNTPGIVACAVCMDFSMAALLFRPGLKSVRRSEEHTSELQSRSDLVCRLLLEKTKRE